MALIVQKFGGTSVGDLQRISNVAKRIAKSKDIGNDIVVVVSAMSGETNKLISYANHFSSMLPKVYFGSYHLETLFHT